MIEFYIVRCHGGEWSHFYPERNGEKPESYSLEGAEITKTRMSKMFYCDFKIIPESDFDKYPVPRRY